MKLNEWRTVKYDIEYVPCTKRTVPKYCSLVIRGQASVTMDRVCTSLQETTNHSCCYAQYRSVGLDAISGVEMRANRESITRKYFYFRMGKYFYFRMGVFLLLSVLCVLNSVFFCSAVLVCVNSERVRV